MATKREVKSKRYGPARAKVLRAVKDELLTGYPKRASAADKHAIDCYNVGVRCAMRAVENVYGSK